MTVVPPNFRNLVSFIIWKKPGRYCIYALMIPLPDLDILGTKSPKLRFGRSVKLQQTLL